MFNQDRRKCFFYGQSSFLRAYQRANQRIWKNYRQSTHNICQEGMRYLQQITEKYLQQRKQDIETSQYTAQFNQNSSADLFSFRMPIEKKPLIQHDQSTQNESKNIVMYTEKKQKTNEGESFESRDSDNEEQDADYLKKSLKKLGINQEDIEDDNIDYENQKENWQITNGFKDKTIQQIIIESNNKLLEVISNKKSVKIQNENNYLSDSQDYPITEYSSNQSSNDNDYEQNFRYTTGQHSKNELSSQESYQSFHSLKDKKSTFPNTKVYATSNITLSPKKSKSKSKRTYLGSKMIPRWAQDLKKVSEQVVKQRKNENFNPQEIYGICIIEKLNTGLILKKQINYQRGSSAKWKKYPQSHFIC